MSVPPDKAVRNLLKADGDVSAIVAQRVYGDIVPSTVSRPYISVFNNDSEHTHRMDGNGQAGHAKARINVDMHADTRATLRDMHDAVRALLMGYRGTVSIDGESLTIQGSFLRNGNDMVAPPSDGSEDATKSRSHDYEIHYEESTS